jgi:hypothetical protein
LLAVGECLLEAADVVGCADATVAEDGLAEALREPASRAWMFRHSSRDLHKT